MTRSLNQSATLQNIADATALNATYAPVNAFTVGTITQLTIPTYDGSGQATHPCVIDLGGSPISGYRYWMGMTPYPGADPSKENPSIVASNDMITWSVPAGVTNPLVPYPGSPLYNSDDHLIYWGGKFWLYYRTSGSGIQDVFSVITSVDGITWAAPKVVYQTAVPGGSVSPAFRVVNGEVLCWFVRVVDPFTYPTDIYRIESKDGYIFGNPTKCSVTFPDGATPWHIDVDYGVTDKGNPVYTLATNAFLPTTDGNHANLYFATSGDGINFEGYAPTIIPAAGTWYDQGLYRPSILRTGGIFRVFFGAYKTTGTQSHVGYADVTVRWGNPKKAAGLQGQFSDILIADAQVGSSYTVGTVKVKGNAPTLILPKATSNVSTMWKAGILPVAIPGSGVIDLYWMVEDANAGTIQFRTYYIPVVPGIDNMGGSTSAFAQNPVQAPGAANVLQRTSFYVNAAYLLSGSVFHVRVSRDGANVTDTYGSDVLILGFKVRYGVALSR